MSTKLFHAVVASGITLGAASVGCAADPVDVPASADAAVASKDDCTAPDAQAASEKTNACDRFCEVAWPTTKGGVHPAHVQECIDPSQACGAYPTGVFGDDTCLELKADGATCDLAKRFLMFCKDTGTSKAWTCPSGTIEFSQCGWPDGG